MCEIRLISPTPFLEDSFMHWCIVLLKTPIDKVFQDIGLTSTDLSSILVQCGSTLRLYGIWLPFIPNTGSHTLFSHLECLLDSQDSEHHWLITRNCNANLEHGKRIDCRMVDVLARRDQCSCVSLFPQPQSCTWGTRLGAVSSTTSSVTIC